MSEGKLLYSKTEFLLEDILDSVVTIINIIVVTEGTKNEIANSHRGLEEPPFLRLKKCLICCECANQNVKITPVLSVIDLVFWMSERLFHFYVPLFSDPCESCTKFR